MTPTYTVPSAYAGDEKSIEPVGCRQAIVPLLAHKDATSPGPPDSLNTPMKTESYATFGEDVIPLNCVSESSGCSHITVPLVAFIRTTVPLRVPTITEPSKTAGEEKPWT